MTVRLRPLRDGDLPALVEVFVAAFQRGYPRVLPADVLAGVTTATVGGWFARWSSELTTTVAIQDDGPVGFVRFGDDSDEADRSVGYVAALYVHPDASGAGVGRLLLEHAVGEMIQAGKSAVTLWVFRDNERARGLYSSVGFVPDGSEVTDPQWRVPQIRMRCELPVRGRVSAAE